MKQADIQKIHAAGLITGEQRDKIIAHFELKEGGNQFFAIVAFIGGTLITLGLILLIASNWDTIPRGVKVGAGVLLMLGAHGAGWWLREVKRKYLKAGETLHFIGSCLFLANIALVGQIYHLVSRPPNAILLWFIGIAALPWLLKSIAQHILTLLACAVWFAVEINQTDSLIFFGYGESQILLYALLGLIYLGFGYLLRRSSFADFAAPTEQLGLLVFQGFAFPLTLGIWEGPLHYPGASRQICLWIFPAMSGLAVLLAALGVSSLKSLNRQWRLTWAFTLAGAVALLVAQMYFAPKADWFFGWGWQDMGFHWIAVVGLFVFCLLQIQVGLQENSPAIVNLGIAFIAANIITTYFRLIGSMARTGTMFLISGVFLIIFAVYLEKKRRTLMQKIKSIKTHPEAK